jgi:nitroimidazol reductase NimA-like FMN-containing flavoprotein (pyridoxamine 5'-phosphate oxidase superfamily)
MSTTPLPVDHSGLGVLAEEECLYRLRTARVGRVAFLSDGYPIILPVNHGMDGMSVVFRTNLGSKLGVAENEMPVAFEVDGIDADRRTGWSVVIRGDAQAVYDPDHVARLNRLGIWPWADAARRGHWVRIRTHEMTGRKILHEAHVPAEPSSET